MITFEQLETEVRRLAAENPDFEYRVTGACLYNPNEKQPGCVFGQAFINLGSPVPHALEGENINVVLSELDIDATDKQQDWVNEVQTDQDAAFSWAAAVQRADEAASDARE